MPYDPEETSIKTVGEVAKGGGITMLTAVTGQGVRFCFQIMLSHFLGAKDYGIYTLARSVLEIANRVALMGLQNGMVNFLAIFKGQADESRLRGAILYSMGMVAIASSVVAILLWHSSNWMATMVFGEPSLAGVIRGFAVALPFYALFTLLAFCSRGLRNMKYYSGMRDVVHPIGNFLLVLSAFLTGMRLEGAVFGFIISTVLCFILMGRLIFKLFPELFSIGDGLVFESKRIVYYSLTLLLLGFSQLFLRYTDRLMLGHFESPYEVGIYNAAAVVAYKMTFFQMAFNSIFAPVIADLYGRGERDEMVRIFKTVTKWTVLLSLPVFLTFVFWGSFILSLFGGEFVDGKPVLVVLSVSELVNVTVGPVGYMLVMTGRHVLEFVNSWILGITNILLNLILIPKYGAVGAALATGFSIAAVNVLRLIEVNRILHCHPYRLDTLKPFASFAVVGGVLWLLNSLYQLDGLLALAALIASMAVYFAINSLLGFAQEDKLAFSIIGNRVWERKKPSRVVS